MSENYKNYLILVRYGSNCSSLTFKFWYRFWFKTNMFHPRSGWSSRNRHHKSGRLRWRILRCNPNLRYIFRYGLRLLRKHLLLNWRWQRSWTMWDPWNLCWWRILRASFSVDVDGVCRLLVLSEERFLIFPMVRYWIVGVLVGSTKSGLVVPIEVFS